MKLVESANAATAQTEQEERGGRSEQPRCVGSGNADALLNFCTYQCVNLGGFLPSVRVFFTLGGCPGPQLQQSQQSILRNTRRGGQPLLQLIRVPGGQR
jgi:hypothetical protein